MGVWIETNSPNVSQSLGGGHTLRGCVDWNFQQAEMISVNLVTPFVGVWIETFCMMWSYMPLESHPSWVCGLKLQRGHQRSYWVSHTLRGCVDWNKSEFACLGLNCSHTLRGCVDWNFLNFVFGYLSGVTPFVGVWIETEGEHPPHAACEVTPFVGVWIETRSISGTLMLQRVTPFVGVWIETIFVTKNR